MTPYREPAELEPEPEKAMQDNYLDIKRNALTTLHVALAICFIVILWCGIRRETLNHPDVESPCVEVLFQTDLRGEGCQHSKQHAVLVGDKLICRCEHEAPGPK